MRGDWSHVNANAHGEQLEVIRAIMLDDSPSQSRSEVIGANMMGDSSWH